MAITDYAGLQAAAADWLNRSDLTAQIPTFIALAEKRLNRDLRTRQMETQATLTTIAGTATVALPADYLDARGVVLQTTPHAVLGFKTPADLSATYGGAATGRPANFAIIGGTIKFGPTPDAAYTVEMTYLAKVPALSDTATTNWALDECPDLYLYATLLEASPFLREDERITVWGQLYDAALGRVQTADQRARWPSGPLAIQVKTQW
ncbi:phage adaptor protein [Azospirillum soli]|uniref:phage adaptor protein n=1 Tax=Azospirillum soli TaxID=1304799 RepID=UPI001AE35176|nr:hypothetical protein [Azospirillum soli]MBP2311886.1 hypothetical protein [Azospirillum soli]